MTTTRRELGQILQDQTVISGWLAGRISTRDEGSTSLLRTYCTKNEDKRGLGGAGGAWENNRLLTSKNNGLGWLFIGVEMRLTNILGIYYLAHRWLLDLCFSIYFLLVNHLGHLLCAALYFWTLSTASMIVATSSSASSGTIVNLDPFNSSDPAHLARRLFCGEMCSSIIIGATFSSGLGGGGMNSNFKKLVQEVSFAFSDFVRGYSSSLLF